jgi:hypothetical protein
VAFVKTGAQDKSWIFATGIVIYRTNPDLFVERLGPRKGAKSWDTIRNDRLPAGQPGVGLAGFGLSGQQIGSSH